MPPSDHPPRVSILLPAFNAESTLEACLASIRRQREIRWECVVVDDGSTDRTSDVAHRAARSDPRFRVLSRARAGLVPALNEGLRACRGPYVARMDADDLMHRMRLGEQCRALDGDPGLAAVGCHVRMFPRAGLGQGSRDYERWINGIDSAAAIRRDAFVECPVAHPSLMIRTEVLRELGYRDRGWPEDYDLLLRLLSERRRVDVIPRRLICWRRTPPGLSQTGPAYRIERFTACKAAFLAASFLAGSERYVLWGYGGTGRNLARALRAHGKRPSRIVELHPRRLGNRIGGAEVVPRESLLRLPPTPIVVSVAGPGPRGEIRDWMRRNGFRELKDFVCAA